MVVAYREWRLKQDTRELSEVMEIFFLISVLVTQVSHLSKLLEMNP